MLSVWPDVIISRCSSSSADVKGKECSLNQVETVLSQRRYLIHKRTLKNGKIKCFLEQRCKIELMTERDSTLNFDCYFSEHKWQSNVVHQMHVSDLRNGRSKTQIESRIERYVRSNAIVSRGSSFGCKEKKYLRESR